MRNVGCWVLTAEHMQRWEKGCILSSQGAENIFQIFARQKIFVDNLANFQSFQDIFCPTIYIYVIEHNLDSTTYILMLNYAWCLNKNYT